MKAKNKKYWHKISKEEIKELGNQTVQYVLDNYKQPDWCEYPDALSGTMGCWSLMGNNRTKISKDFCRGCDEFIKEK